MAENQILPFAYADGANVLSQADYQADNQRLIGHQPGIARSALENKALRQASAMAAGLAQFIADGQAADVTDSKTPAEIAAMLVAVTDAKIRGQFEYSSEGSTFRGGFALPEMANGDRVSFRYGYVNTSGTEQAQYVATVAYPVAFPTRCLTVVTSAGSNDANAPLVTTAVNASAAGFTMVCKRGNVTGNVPLNVPLYYVAIGY